VVDAEEVMPFDWAAGEWANECGIDVLTGPVDWRPAAKEIGHVIGDHDQDFELRRRVHRFVGCSV
jgi:hypothetical protein